MAKKISEIERMKEEFLIQAAHEFKTPITLIQGFTRLILDRKFGKIKKKQEDILKTIESETEKLNYSVEKILNLSMCSCGTLKLSKSKSNLEGLIKKVVSEINPIAKHKNVRITKQLSKLPDITIDKDKIKLVVYHLLENAIKFSNKGVVCIKTQRDGGNVIIHILDEAGKIDKKNIDKIFKMYFKVNPFASGSGLGLTACKKLIEAHKGKIWVRSKTKGNIFSFSLPIK